MICSHNVTVVYSHVLTEEGLGASDEGMTIRTGSVVVDSSLWMDEMVVGL